MDGLAGGGDISLWIQVDACNALSGYNLGAKVSSQQVGTWIHRVFKAF